MTNIIFCADGTWNKDSSDGVVTNVVKFFDTLVQSDKQTAKYDDGVGADGTQIQHWLGGLIGDGLFQKIRDGYDYIAQEYNDGDKIYLFGFSRGAYTARSLAGMIAKCGLPDKNKYDRAMTQATFDAYRSPNPDALMEQLTAQYGHKNVDIIMVGVWETVGSLGIPGTIFHDFDQEFYGFLDTALHPNIKSAYHALAIDEQRKQFPPTLWEGAIKSDQHLRQVWFSGAHSDIGGGYPESDLSDIPLAWMMRMAKAQGVLFNDAGFKRYTAVSPVNALALAHQSWNMDWGNPKPRDIMASNGSDKRMAKSVHLRWQQESPSYRPDNCTTIFGQNPFAIAIEEVFFSS